MVEQKYSKSVLLHYDASTFVSIQETCRLSLQAHSIPDLLSP